MNNEKWYVSSVVTLTSPMHPEKGMLTEDTYEEYHSDFVCMYNSPDDALDYIVGGLGCTYKWEDNPNVWDDDDDDSLRMSLSYLVGEGNWELDDWEVEEWKKGKKRAWIKDIEITISKVKVEKPTVEEINRKTKVS